MPERRKLCELSPDAQRRAAARRKLNLYVYYGKIKKLPCEVCGASHVEAHHPDYSKPLEVEWLCPEHHRERERADHHPRKGNTVYLKPNELIASPLVKRYRDEVAAERDLEPDSEPGVRDDNDNLVDDQFDAALGEGRR
jgi:hypothetical protein